MKFCDNLLVRHYKWHCFNCFGVYSRCNRRGITKRLIVKCFEITIQVLKCYIARLLEMGYCFISGHCTISDSDTTNRQLETQKNSTAWNDFYIEMFHRFSG